jgi:hypothetical protein
MEKIGSDTGAELDRSVVSFHLANCDAKTALFLGDVVRLFCDPELKDTLRYFRSGRMAIGMIPNDGRAVLIYTQNK